MPAATGASLTGNTYQVGKFMKHTIPPGSGNLIGVFSDPSYVTYEGHVANVATSGWYEVDAKGQTMAIFAGATAGLVYSSGQFLGPADAVKLVIPWDTGRIHAYPYSSPGLATATCDDCGTPVPS